MKLGLTFTRLEQNNDAIKSFKQATSINTDAELAHYTLGMIYQTIERHDDVLKSF